MNSQGMDTVRLIYISEKSSLDPNKFMQREFLRTPTQISQAIDIDHRYQMVKLRK